MSKIDHEFIAELWAEDKNQEYQAYLDDERNRKRKLKQEKIRGISLCVALSVLSYIVFIY